MSLSKGWPTVGIPRESHGNRRSLIRYTWRNSQNTSKYTSSRIILTKCVGLTQTTYHISCSLVHVSNTSKLFGYSCDFWRPRSVTRIAMKKFGIINKTSRTTWMSLRIESESEVTTYNVSESWPHGYIFTIRTLCVLDGKKKKGPQGYSREKRHFTNFNQSSSNLPFKCLMVSPVQRRCTSTADWQRNVYVQTRAVRTYTNRPVQYTRRGEVRWHDVEQHQVLHGLTTAPLPHVRS